MINAKNTLIYIFLSKKIVFCRAPHHKYALLPPFFSLQKKVHPAQEIPSVKFRYQFTCQIFNNQNDGGVSIDLDLSVTCHKFIRHESDAASFVSNLSYLQPLQPRNVSLEGFYKCANSAQLTVCFIQYKKLSMIGSLLFKNITLF